MNSQPLDESINRVAQLKLRAVDQYVDSMVESLSTLNSPEKLLGKPYEQWTGHDFQRLVQVYGDKSDTPLANLVFRKEYEKVKQLEAATELE